MADRSEAPCIVWFRDDLRLSDHPALHAAAATGRPVICLYIFDETSRHAGVRPIGGAARWWLAQSLRALQRSLGTQGVPLVVRKGSAARIVPDVAREVGASDVVWNESHKRRIRPSSAKSRRRRRISASTCKPSQAISSPRRTPCARKKGAACGCSRRSGGACRRSAPHPIPCPHRAACARDQAWRAKPSKASLSSPHAPIGPAGLRESWTPGERPAQERLETFLKERLAGYAHERDRPDRDGTSGLSPHLRFGEISPRQVWHATHFAAAERPALASDADKFLSELGWREFCRHLLFDVPDLATRNLQPSFDAFPWRRDKTALKAWQRGQTGYPIVDAGMRQLWRTGVMHNRVRMVVASFLVKHLLVDWREGEKWFWDTLVDADAGNNPANWQWVAGCGADAAPYFRVFNPVLQGEKFDPDGTYVRRWVPELVQLPNKFIHQPWEAAPLELAGTGIILGKTYPHLIVDHRKGRERALKAYEKVRAN